MKKAVTLFIISELLKWIILPLAKTYSFFHYWIDEKKSLKDWFYNNAITTDILGNVNGEWLEHLLTKRRDTLFGKKNITISQSVGEIIEKGDYYEKKVNFFSKALDWAFNEPNHCTNAYNDYLNKNKK